MMPASPGQRGRGIVRAALPGFDQLTGLSDLSG
jgi:hypothetical protein